MQIFYTVAQLQHYRQNTPKSIAFVPTMGGLHQGHISLIATAKRYAQSVIVSIFVNKTQFALGEDFDKYPRTPQTDITLLKQHNVDILFMPTHKEIYPAGTDTNIDHDPGDIAHRLCGRSRPTHFAGVTQVVYRLFQIVQPTVAVFGKKDYQQLIIIKQMVSKLQLPVRIIGGEIKRDNTGLALSTRNQYLTPTQRILAQKLHTTLARITAYDDIIQGNREIAHILGKLYDLDYCTVLDAKNLGKITSNTTTMIILAAVYIGSVRLIDNYIFTP